MKSAFNYVSIFKPHSCRSASSLAAKNASVPIEKYSERDNGSIAQLLTNIITGTQKILICNIQREFYHNKL